MSAASSNPTPESTRRGGDAKHPVLARLPDVSGQPSAAHRAKQESAPAEYVDYRFDAPAGTEDQAAPVRRLTRPHAFQRTSQERSRSLRRSSRIQPDSDPFALPTTSLYDRLAPVARFLMLFALFTAAGTAFLMKGGFAKRNHETNHSENPPSTPATTSIRQSLEPVTEHIESAAGPTASGPMGANAKAGVEDLFAHIDEQLETVAEHETTAPTLTGANGAPLPRVQTTDPQTVEIALNGAENAPARPEEPTQPPAIARLPGFIREVPPR